MSFRLPLLAAILACACLAPGAVAAVPSEHGLALATTPELIAAAVARGEISRAAGLRYLARSFAPDPQALPERLRGGIPSDGTIPLLQLRRAARTLRPGPTRTAVLAVTTAATTTSTTASCGGGGDPVASVPNATTYPSAGGHFAISYDPASVTAAKAQQYATSLDVAWEAEVNQLAWPAPPIKAQRYPVVIAAINPSYYGFTTDVGDGAGKYVDGDNPATAWTEPDAESTCMALNSTLPNGNNQAGLDAATAHEFNHAIQYGLGALDESTDNNDWFAEAGATWVEDEVQDASDDNLNYLYFDPSSQTTSPSFSESLFPHTVNSYEEYASWLLLRLLTDRFGSAANGTLAPAGGQTVIRDAWEYISGKRRASDGQPVARYLDALNQAIRDKDPALDLAHVYHDGAQAMWLLHDCTGGVWTSPFCLQEASHYGAALGIDHPPAQAELEIAATAPPRSLRSNYATTYLRVPSAALDASVRNDSDVHSLLASVECTRANATDLVRVPLGTGLIGPGTVALAPNLDLSACDSQSAALVVTSASATSSNPTGSARVYFQAGVTAPGSGAPPYQAPTPDPTPTAVPTATPVPANPTPTPIPVPADTAGPKMKIQVLRRATLFRLTFLVTCPLAETHGCRGDFSVYARARRGTRKLRLGARTFGPMRGGDTKSVRLVIPRSLRHRIRRGRNVLTVKAGALDSLNNRSNGLRYTLVTRI